VARTSLSKVLGELVRFSVNVGRRFGGYVLDLQESTEPIWRGARWVMESVEVMDAMVRSIRPGKAAGTSVPVVTGLTEYAAWLTMTGRMPFRRAHYLCGRVASMLISGSPIESVQEFLRGSGLDEDAVAELEDFLNPERVLNSYAVTGSAREDEVRRMVVELRRECEELRSWAEERLRAEAECRKRLLGIT